MYQLRVYALIIPLLQNLLEGFSLSLNFDRRRLEGVRLLSKFGGFGLCLLVLSFELMTSGYCRSN